MLSTLLKRYSITSIFLWNLWNILEHLFLGTSAKDGFCTSRLTDFPAVIRVSVYNFFIREYIVVEAGW